MTAPIQSHSHPAPDSPDCWPALPLESWEATRATLHMWTQIVGKVRLALTPLGQSLVERPALRQRPRPDHFLDALRAISSSKSSSISSTTSSSSARATARRIRSALAPKSVADFLRRIHRHAPFHGIDVKIWKMPVEIPDPIAFDKDETPRLLRSRSRPQILAHPRSPSSDVFQDFRALFIGKSSPVHFFWGSFDLAVTPLLRPPRTRPTRRRLSSPRKPIPTKSARRLLARQRQRKGRRLTTPTPAPNPPASGSTASRPPPLHYRKDLGEFILPYEAVRTRPDPPARASSTSARSTYEAAATNAKWPREDLERKPSRDSRVVTSQPTTQTCEPAVHFAAHNLPRINNK